MVKCIQVPHQLLSGGPSFCSIEDDRKDEDSTEYYSQHNKSDIQSADLDVGGKAGAELLEAVMDS